MELADVDQSLGRSARDRLVGDAGLVLSMAGVGVCDCTCDDDVIATSSILCGY